MSQFYTNKPYKSNKDKKDIQNHYRSDITNFEQSKIRVLRYDLVFVNGLPSNISSKQILNDELYFGRYGKVLKSILNPPFPFKKNTNYQAYATYQNQLNASIAVVALNGFILDDKPLKVSYGTTKYCTNFLQGKQCNNSSQCFYLHKYERDRQLLNGQSKSMFQKQNQRAINMVLDNLQSVILKILDSKIEEVDQGFPSLSQMIEFLIDSEWLDGKYYDELYEEMRKKRKKTKEQAAQQSYQKIKETQNQVTQKLKKNQYQTPKKSQVQQTGQQQSSLQHININLTPKLLKSNSFSTMTSPYNKICFSQFDQQEKRDNQRQNFNEKSKNIIKTISHQQSTKRQSIQIEVDNPKINNEEYRICRSDDEIKNNKISQSVENAENLQEKISNKIIKEIMNKKVVKSKFDWIRSDMKNNQMMQEIKKVKNIMEVVLMKFQ